MIGEQPLNLLAGWRIQTVAATPSFSSDRSKWSSASVGVFQSSGAAVAAALNSRPRKTWSLTWDQGAEMTQHARLKIDTGVQVYFCDPHSPWQRGPTSNTNGLLAPVLPQGHRSQHAQRRGGRSCSGKVMIVRVMASRTASAPCPARAGPFFTRAAWP
jgi:hypothetical protein